MDRQTDWNYKAIFWDPNFHLYHMPLTNMKTYDVNMDDTRANAEANDIATPLTEVA